VDDDMTHPILTAHPAYQQWEKRGADLAKRRDSLARQVMAAQQEEAKVDAAHAVKVQEAVEKSKPIPSRPERPDLSHLDAALGFQRRAEEAHRDQRTSVVAEVAADGGLLGVEDRLEAGLARITEVAPTIRDAQADLQETLAVYRDMVRAQDIVNGLTIRPPRASRVRTTWDVDSLLSAAVADLMALEPIPKGTGTMIMPGDAGPEREPPIVTHNRAIAAEAARLLAGGKVLGLTVDAGWPSDLGDRIVRPPDHLPMRI
jgi:hypothetical protein